MGDRKKSVSMACTLYVCGEEPTLAAAARRTGARYETVRRRARGEDWRTQRAEFIERQHRLVLEEVATREARAIIEVRRATSEAMVVAARRILAELQAEGDDKSAVRPGDLEKLVKTFLVLADHRSEPAPDVETLAAAYVELRGAVGRDLGPDGLRALDQEVDAGAGG